MSPARQSLLPHLGRGSQALVIAASLVIVIAGLKAAASLLLPFLGAGFIALITLPLLNWLQGKRIPRSISVLITLLIALGFVALVVVLITESIDSFTREAPKYRAGLTAMTADVVAWFRSHGIDLSDQLRPDLIDPGQAVDFATRTLRGATAVLQNTLLVTLTIVFILLEAAGLPAKLRAAFGEESTGYDRFAVIRAEVQHYLGIKTLVSLTTGGIVAGAMAVIGLDFPLLWGLVAFLLNYIPALGSIIAAVPPVILALIQFGPGRALVVAAVFLAINIGLGNLLEPQLMGRRLGLSTLVVFVSLVFWGWLWGPVGMLLSVPLTMIIKIMMENTEDLRWIAVLLDAGPPRGDTGPGERQL